MRQVFRVGAQSCAVAALALAIGVGGALAQDQERQQRGDQGRSQPAQQAPANRPAEKMAPAQPRAQGAPAGQNRQSQGQGESRRPTAQSQPPQKSQTAPNRSARERGDNDRTNTRRQSEERSTPRNKSATDQSRANRDVTNSRQSSKDAARSSRNRQAGTRNENDRANGQRQGNVGDRGPSAPNATASGAGPQGTRLSDQQRQTIRQRFTELRVRPTVSRVNFAVQIGTRVPRSVKLVVVPASVVAIAPFYRGYRYFVADDRIVIVEPSSYQIVDVIEYRTTGGGQINAALELTGEERAFILANLPRVADPGEFRFRLALGADVPERVTLRLFPQDIVRRIPRLESYRFTVVGDDVVIADPRSREIALVIR